VLVILGTLGIVATTIVIGLWVDRRYPLLPSRKSLESAAERERKQLVMHAAGEAPGTALRVHDAQIAKLRTNQRCLACRAVMATDTDDHVRFDDHELLVLRFTCGGCNTGRALYIRRLAD
jgi:RNase P subunit RPR2